MNTEGVGADHAAAPESDHARLASLQREAAAEQVSNSIVHIVWRLLSHSSQGSLLARLREEKMALAKQKRLLTCRLKNEQRKRQRLREKAKKLSNEDLLQVWSERQSLVIAKAKAKAKARP